MSLPKALSFPQTKASAVAAVASNFSCKPITGQTWAPSSTISFDIPCGTRSTWLDTAGTYLMLDVSVSVTTTGTVQFMGFDFIRSLNLYASAGSQNIESVNEYAVLHGMLRDLCSDHNNWTSDSLMLGSDPARTRVAATRTISSTAPTIFRFAIPLVSILGTLSAGSTYLPLFGLNAPLRLDIGLNSVANATAIVATAAGVGFTVVGASLQMTNVTISDLAQSQIMSMTGGQFNWNSQVWRMHKSVHPAGQVTDTVVIPSRCDSMRSILVAQRLAANLELGTRLSNYERIRNYLNSYQFRVGSSFANPKPVDTTGLAVEGYMECRKVFGSVSSESCPTLLAALDFSGDAPLAPSAAVSVGTVDHGSFVIGLEMQPFSQVQGLISGTSTLANNVYLDLNYSSSVAAADITSFIEADALFQVDANLGTLTVRF